MLFNIANNIRIIENAENIQMYIGWVESLQSANRWVNVKDRLPEDKSHILYADVFGHVGSCKYYSWSGFSDHAMPINGITHWRELPAAPVKEGEG